ncbi:hypothetical protein DENSPDRAFT_769383 [Dentipellis sp. KUC8613]|nr:hypothetical protein DENSPDRAFT_769383 [Dentipellis sp. KUC8613]
MPNQHKPCPPEAELKPAIERFYRLGLNDGEIAAKAIQYFDTEEYGLSARSVKRFRTKWGFLSTRQQRHTLDTVTPFIEVIKRRYPQRGADAITKALRMEYNIRAPRYLVLDYLRKTEPEAVKARRYRRFIRRRFWATGLNDVWAIDQHDKWQRFGLFLHACVDPYHGYIHWVKIWWTNKNPRLIASFYLEAARREGGIPLVTQSDPGSENFGVANAQTYIRHRLDASLSDTLQHRWMRKHQNIKPEAHWSVMRRDFSPGFENLLDQGIQNGWYNPNDAMDSYLFRWLGIPWLQRELDEWVYLHNHTIRRANKHKMTPHGIPELIRENPADYQSIDVKVLVPGELFDEAEQLWAPPGHPVFELVPQGFAQYAQVCYEAIQEPVVTSDSFWDVYLALRDVLTEHAGDAPLQQAFLETPQENRLMDELLPIPEGLKELGPIEAGNMAAAANAREPSAVPQQEALCAEFSDMDDDEFEDDDIL